MNRMLAAWCAVAGACLSFPALAGLGDDAAAVGSDLARMKGQLRVETAAACTVHEITVADRGVLREYVSGSGKIFAVSWRGTVPPDLQSLLSRYYPQYAQAPASGRSGHHHSSLDQPGLVVRSAAHARSFFTRAWAPDLLPQNFAVNDIY